mgnify:CR=1 FL=1
MTIDNTYQKPAHGWTCFHCGETFTTTGSAQDHFGKTPQARPGCEMKVILGGERGLLSALRRTEDQLARWQNEETDLHKMLAREQSRHGDALMAAEEAGYARGLNDQTLAMAVAESYQNRVHAWMLQCFGETVTNNKMLRYMRFGEEALELIQATGASREEAHLLVDYVFGRPVGEPNQEVGGVMVTLAALCHAHGLEMEACAEVELAKVWLRMPEIRAKQALKNHALTIQQAAGPTTAGGHLIGD